MKTFVLKSFLLVAVLFAAIPAVQAQFDDVYYDPDLSNVNIGYTYSEQESKNPDQDIIYYDDDSYAYYDDYDFYYSSRIRRFHRPYGGFGFYDPIYVGYNYYDPFAWNNYGYPGANIYVSFGAGFGFGFGSPWYAPPPFFYGYNNWYYPVNHWNGWGWGGYYPYGNYYNPYCPPPPYYGGYYPPYDGHHGNPGDFHYGPRTAGNTSTSPRFPQNPPGIVRTDPKLNNPDADVSKEGTGATATPGSPGRATQPGASITKGDPIGPAVRQESSDVVRQIPVDRELPTDKTPTGPKRPVFKPDTERYQPYPSTARPGTSVTPGGATDTPRPSTSPVRPTETPKGEYKPYPQSQNREGLSPTGNDRPSGNTNPGIIPDSKPRYTTPPPRTNERNNDRPSYTPPPRSTQEPRSNDRPSYTPPPRSSQESRSNDRPSYSPPSRSESQPSYSPPSRSSSPSSGGARSSGGGGSSPSSPRGGRG